MSLLGAGVTCLLISLGLLIAFIILVSRLLHAWNSEKIYWVCFIISLFAEIISIRMTWDYENASIPYLIAMVLILLAGICYLSPLNINSEGNKFFQFRARVRSLLSPESTEYENDPEKRKVIIGWSSKILGALALIPLITKSDEFNKLIVINLIAALLLSLLHDLYSYKLEAEKG